MAGPSNAIVGDENYGTDLPQMEVDTTALTEEKKMARYSKTAEFARIKEHCEAKIAYYQQYLPDGRLVTETMPTPEQWLVANEIIKEFNLLLNSYKITKEVVDENAPV